MTAGCATCRAVRCPRENGREARKELAGAARVALGLLDRLANVTDEEWAELRHARLGASLAHQTIELRVRRIGERKSDERVLRERGAGHATARTSASASAAARRISVRKMCGPPR